MSIPVGTRKRLKATVTDDTTGLLTDPGVFTLYATAPRGTPQPFTPTRESQGVYHYDLLFDTPGVWTVAWVASGGVDVSTPDEKLTCDSSAVH